MFSFTSTDFGTTGDPQEVIKKRMRCGTFCYRTWLKYDLNRQLFPSTVIPGIKVIWNNLSDGFL